MSNRGTAKPYKRDPYTQSVADFAESVESAFITGLNPVNPDIMYSRRIEKPPETMPVNIGGYTMAPINLAEVPSTNPLTTQSVIEKEKAKRGRKKKN